jgi:hypothetical protein
MFLLLMFLIAQLLQLSAYYIYDVEKKSGKAIIDRPCMIVDPAGNFKQATDIMFEPVEGAPTWQSPRTFVDFPLKYRMVSGTCTRLKHKHLCSCLGVAIKPRASLSGEISLLGSHCSPSPFRTRCCHRNHSRLNNNFPP